MKGKPRALPPGIESRDEKDGRIRYRALVRRQGEVFRSSWGTLPVALAYRAQALAALDGTTERPVPAQRHRVTATGPARAVTVQEAATRFARGMKDGTARTRDGRPYSLSTTRNYEGALRRDVIRVLGYVPISTLTGGDAQRFVDELAAEKSPEHARHALAALRCALGLAVRHGEIPANPCAGTRVPTDAEDDEEPRWLAPKEATALLAAAEAEDRAHKRSFAAPLVTLGLGTGLRLGELLALPWGPEGLDVKAGVVHVRRSLDRARDDEGNFPFVPPKSKASRRDVPLSPDDAARLRRHRLATRRPVDGALVFPDEHGQPLAAHALPRSAWDAVVTRAKLTPKPTAHDMRHTYATWALAAGLTVHAVAALLGHADPGLVLRRYGHALPSEVAGAGATLSAWRQAQTG